ncbi:hypothetical protein QJS10_CPB20g00278 [Acorus calamus]|uniref:Uncharacterized protein n=1 Tax=Acorus calamus TaxID=4465 RepID=A0AAV9CAR5_ACOCL|nr:hypothetical protein QJS10_CPB20g00278 [Acorus calamus]
MNNRSCPSTPSLTRFARCVRASLASSRLLIWVRSVGLRDHPRHGRVVAARRARRIRDDASPALEFHIGRGMTRNDVTMGELVGELVGAEGLERSHGGLEGGR